ncbi:T9SS type A sorting domain-containing protein [Dyadobacter sp. NIV53]|uniref:T9SS type A sorting domain-containing protein n=1 Tax=Dyadobacter sp. NIV53 TaxID=2861765 RepID=UPI001C877AC2|nr:T9SS type A sorting domain-containing protein [Dyadobacter sp. NIV53]
MKLVFYSIVCILFVNTLKAQSFVLKTKTQLAAEIIVAKTKADFFKARSLKLTPRSIERRSFLPCAQTASPVKSLTFSGERIDDAHVALFWETSQLVNNDYFQVERTLNLNSGFDPVATGKLSENLTSTGKYGLSDPNRNTGYTYYRFKQVDTDGGFRYSSVIAIKGISVPLGIIPYPNPGQGKNIAFIINGLFAAQAINIAIYDNRGKIVYQDKSFPVSPEMQKIKIDLPNLALGKYSIKIKSGDDDASNSFIIIP